MGEVFKQSRGYIVRSLGVLTLLYFTLEVLLNYTLYKYLAISSDAFGAQAVEYWGKVIAGLGLSLLLTKLIFIRSWQVPTYTIFAIVSVFTIPASFYMQDKIAQNIVQKASKRQINEAALIVAVRSSIAPHYSLGMASYSIEKDLSKRGHLDKVLYPIKRESQATSRNYIANKAIFLEASKRCRVEAFTSLGLDPQKPDRGLFWVLDALNTPLSSSKEGRYISTVNTYQRCLYEDQAYRENHSGSVGVLAGKKYLDRLYQDYEYQSTRYQEELAGLTGDHHRERRLALNKVWRRELDELFGFHTTLKPRLVKAQFLRHPDIKRKYLSQVKKMGGSNDNAMPLYLYDEGFDESVKEQIYQHLPKNGSSHYTKLDEPITDKHLEDNQMAYKALVMPLIGLGLSAFFLIINFILSVCNWLFRAVGRKIAIAVFVAAMSWFLIYPYMSFIGYNNSASWTYPAKWLYYHEKNLAKAHHWVLNE